MLTKTISQLQVVNPINPFLNVLCFFYSKRLFIRSQGKVNCGNTISKKRRLKIVRGYRALVDASTCPESVPEANTLLKVPLICTG